MRHGKENIYRLPASDIPALGIYARQIQLEAEARGETLPPAVFLQMGEPSFRTPEHIRQAAVASIENEPMPYGPPAGWPWLRELIAAKIKRVNGYSIEPANVAVTLGGTGGLQMALHATVGPGDEVLIPDPGWPHYMMQLAVCGATPIPYRLDVHNDWLPDVAHLEQLVTSRTRLLLINTPANPSGAVFPSHLVHDLLEFARRHDLYLISDECYDEMIFEGQHISPGTMLTPQEFEDGRFIGIYSFSKTYSMTGWRVGYLVTGKPLLKTITDVLNAGQTNLSLLSQRAGAAALTGPQECVAAMREAYRHNRDLAIALLKEHWRYDYTPHGAFYVLIDIGRSAESLGQQADQSAGSHDEIGDPYGTLSRQFMLDLLRAYNVVVAPGSSFGTIAEDYVRISLAASAEEIERGVRAICRFADR
ncbi:MAG TPA: pyridoxal phosphate-dependent aminotransferase [Ktedonosporobacter sp.]|nr:pyridoxal phosphate-dependent aminotransferase [Ktedonosporobacter sp.]